MRQSKAIALLIGLCLLTTACAKGKSKRAPPRPTSTAAENNKPSAPPSDMNDKSIDRAALGKTETQLNNRETRVAESKPLRSDTSYSRVEEHTVDAADVRAESAKSSLQNASESVVETEGANNTGGARNEQCGTAYRANVEQWFPGLPYPPAQTRICTGGSVGKIDEKDLFRCEAGSAFVFTDGRLDGLMALVIERFSKLPAYMDRGSRNLSRMIRDVQVQGLGSRTLNVRITMFAGLGKYDHIDLQGQVGKKSGSEIVLRQVSRNTRRFGGKFTCADASGLCQNAIIRLDRKTDKGGIAHAAFIVYRAADAHVTMSDQDRVAFRSIQNRAQARFSEYLSNTVNNTCLNILADLNNGARKIPTCAYQRLQAQCGKSDFRRPAAKRFEFRSWAVTYGRSGFEFVARDNAQEDRLRISGPLVFSNKSPVWPRSLRVGGILSKEIESAILMANDGGGNINLLLNFNGGGERSQTRISVTNLAEDTRLGPDQVAAQAARKMRSLQPKELADERDVKDLTDAQQKVKEETKEEEQKVETKEEAKPIEAPKADAPKADATKTEEPKTEAPKADAPKTETPVEAPKPETAPKVEDKTVEQSPTVEQKPAAVAQPAN